jgi:alkylation response protein AidB-like acyl-CoA dehydrogenase
MSATGPAVRWLELLRTAAHVDERDLCQLSQFEETLTGLLTGFPINSGLAPDVRSQNLQQIRIRLARTGHLALAVPGADGGRGHLAVTQAMMQFVCGYHDADLRDATGLGHGRLIAEHAAPGTRDRWLPALLAGAVPGVAITEAHGGSQVYKTATAAIPGPADTWLVSGTKTWISRLHEAAVFCVFFCDPQGQLTAAAIDAANPGLTRQTLVPAGLTGWTWGELHLREVPVQPCDILGRPGDGMRLLREHFAHYRPLVAATALGAAAGVHDYVTARLDERRRVGAITDLRDNALITLGRTYAQINAAILATLNAQHLADADRRIAELWGCVVKAHGADTASQAASELALLIGAAGFTASSRTAKARQDLNALLYADGIHDSLYRTAGRTLMTSIRRSGADYASGRPFSKAATDPASTASRHAAIRLASSGVTSPATSSRPTNANPASSPSASLIAAASSADSTPPS